MLENNRTCTTQYTKILSDFTANLRYEDIPPEVLERAKMVMLQTVGVALAAKASPEAHKIIETARDANGGVGGTATGWGTGDRLSPGCAALQNGTLADLLDWEDTAWTGHPSAGIVPVAWVMAESLKKGGRELLTAIVAAYEVYQRIAMVVQPSLTRQRTKGWGLTSWQLFGCIVPAVKLKGFTSEQVNQALGLGAACSTLPTSFHEFCMSDFYHYEHGLRAREGVMIAELVEKGVKGCLNALDNPADYELHITDEPRPEWYTKELGERWLIMTTLLKHWPANMWVQTPVEIAYDLVTEHGIKPEYIRDIIVDPPKEGRMDTPPDEGFRSLTHAQFSTPYVISALIHDRHPGAHWYSPAMLQNPSVISLAQRVLPGDSDRDAMGVGFKMFQQGSFPRKTVTINLKDGRSYSASLDCQLGHPANMMSREQFAGRFRIQASPVLDGERMERALDALLHIEDCDDISRLHEFLY